VGYRDESAEIPGISRLLARMMLRSATQRPAAPSALDPRSLGGLLGVDASFDTTRYYAAAPSAKTKELLTFQAEMIQEPAFAQDQLQREAANLAEEDRWNGGLPPPRESGDELAGYQEPSDYSMARLLEIISSGNEAGAIRRVNPDALRSIPRERLAEFYRGHYRPANLIIAIAGDVSTFAILLDVQQRYAEFGTARPTSTTEAPNTRPDTKPRTSDSRSPAPGRPPAAGAPAPVPGPEVPKPEEPRLRYGSDRGSLTQSIVTLGFRAPGGESTDWPALEVLSAIIGQGRGSRLYLPLLDGQPTLYRADSNYFPFRGGGVLTAQMWLNPDAIDTAESLMFRELDRLRREVVGESELVRAKMYLESTFVDRTSTYPGRARALAQAEASGEGYRAALDYRDRIRPVRAEDVQRVAAKYMTTSAACLHEYEPQSAAPRSFDAPRFAATVAAWAPSFSQPVESIQTADTASQTPLVPQGGERTAAERATYESMEPLPVRDFSTLNGPRAFVREDHSLPLVTMALLFQGGRVAEDEATSGITELMLRSLLYGAVRQNPARVADELEQLGARVDVVIEPDFFGLVATALSRNADSALRIMRDVIEEPAFRDPDIARARQVQTGMIRGARDSARERSFELLLQALYPGNPCALPPHGREEVLAKTGGEQIRGWYERTIKRQVPIAIIVGDTDGSALVSGRLAEGFRRRDLDRTLQLRVPQAAKPSDKIEQRSGQSSFAMIGVSGPKGDSPDLAVLDVIESALKRPGGQIFSQPKDRPAFAFGAMPGHDAFLTAGVIYFELLSSSENEAAARTLLAGEMDRIARAGVSPEQLSAAVAASSASQLTELQSPMARAMQYASAFVRQRQPSEVDSFADRYSKVTVDDIKRVAAYYFKPTGLSAGIVRGTSSK
jgi:zinc protease